ncbi:AAA family ATPase [Nocardia transvalensis]|nr:AAA family ATPase [Nocardia transvalensis]
MIVQTDPRRPCVVLVGPPGAGKSTIGRKLAKELGVELFDTDAGIEAETGRTIPEIFADDGEPEFRRIEERVVRRAVLSHTGVVSLGGGAVLSSATRELLRGRTVVYLEISVAEGLRRTGAGTNRPLLTGDDPGAKYRALMRERRPFYREVASVRVRTDGRSPGRVVRNIMARLDLQPAEPKPTSAPPRPVDGEGTSRRARARRRRRGQSKYTGVQTNSTTATTDRDAPAAAPDEAAGTMNAEAPATNSTGPRRRSRRSRRGGRRRSGTVTTADSPADSGLSRSSGATTPATGAAPTSPEPANSPPPSGRGNTGENQRTATNSDETHSEPDAAPQVSKAEQGGRRRRKRGVRRAAGAPGETVPTGRHPAQPADGRASQSTPAFDTANPVAPQQHSVAGQNNRRSRRTATRPAGPPTGAPAHTAYSTEARSRSPRQRPSDTTADAEVSGPSASNPAAPPNSATDADAAAHPTRRLADPASVGGSASFVAGTELNPVGGRQRHHVSAQSLRAREESEQHT